MTLLYDWLKKAAKAQGNNKAVVYRDNYLSWRGLLQRVDRRAQEFKSMGIKDMKAGRLEKACFELPCSPISASVAKYLPGV